MFSLYVHIPFCRRKCKYCSFFVVPTEDVNLDKLKNKYFFSLFEEIKYWSNRLIDKQIKTIYIWWGTPLEIGKDKLFELIDEISDKFDLNFLEEIDIELNPDPYDEVLEFIKEFNKRYERKFFRIRFSFGIQTFDDDISRKSWRWYIYNTLIWFLRDLQKIKKVNNVFNFDFIAFGTKWRDYKYDFFEKFVKSMFADSFSLYMLELFPGSQWYNNLDIKVIDDTVYEEYMYLKRIITQSGYKRYEISNYSLVSKESIHNLVYWNMENYIWLWMNASSFLNINFIKNNNLIDILNISDDSNVQAVRWTNTTSWKKYFENKFFDLNKFSFLDDTDYKIEEFILKLRTKQGVSDIREYESILVDNWEDKLKDYIEDKLVYFDDNKFKLTSRWMDIYNHIVTNLVKNI